MKKGVKFDYKQAYNKNLKPSARLHYLENARHDQDSPAKKIGPQGLGVKGNNGYTIGSPAKMGHKSPAKKYGSPMEKYGSPMKMGAHAIHKHMGGSPFLAAANPDLEYMPIVKDATGERKGTTGDPVMDAYISKEKRKKEFEKTSKNKKAKVTKVSGASVKSDSTPKIDKSKPTKKEAPKSQSKKSERKVKSLDRKAKRAEIAEASGNTRKADRLKRSAQRKKDRIARKNK